MTLPSTTGRNMLNEPLLATNKHERVSYGGMVTYNAASCAGASAAILALRKQAMVSCSDARAQPAFSAKKLNSGLWTGMSVVRKQNS